MERINMIFLIYKNANQVDTGNADCQADNNDQGIQPRSDQISDDDFCFHRKELKCYNVTFILSKL